jgi:hypothetical protein
LGWWLAERQLPSGSLNGRHEKLPDAEKRKKLSSVSVESKPISAKLSHNDQNTASSSLASLANSIKLKSDRFGRKPSNKK